ncbi:MAG: UTP--glucose-1-phosphate uridylyltransferase GalU [Pyrinomonadaceae bacterium]|nr:UTP--glucose-1-phosphate uridylyltransferase GalU [Pyrinomonadaceae bacterium]MDW8304588.1 UTP--glucose-1-phosphate uridylyltransferase GalU [Acidobacteriota bacterium]
MNERNKKIRKAVFPAAGLGTRFLPATKASPKEMLPLVDKPLIQYSVEEAVDCGVESILIITGRDKTAIEDHFDISFELEQVLLERGKTEMFELVRRVSELAKISYTRQKQALGLGHAIYQARDFVNNEPFAVLLADDVVDAPRKSALQQLIDVYEKYSAPVIATMRVQGDAISRFGVIDAEQVEERVFLIKDMIEKPKLEEAPSDLAIVGRYIFTPDIFEAIERTEKGAGGEIQITDAMRLMVKEGKTFYAVELEGTRHDAGDKLGFLIATVEYALKHEELAEDFKNYLKSLQTRL